MFNPDAATAPAAFLIKKSLSSCLSIAPLLKDEDVDVDDDDDRRSTNSSSPAVASFYFQNGIQETFKS